MKQYVLILVTLLTVALRAETLVVEDFNYALGSDLTDSLWFTQWGEASGITVTNGLTFSGREGSEVGGAAMIDVKSSSSQAHLAFEPVLSGDIYAAFLFEPAANWKDGYFFSFRDSLMNDYSTFNFNGRIFIGEEYNLGLTFADNQKKVMSSYTLDADSVYLLVLRYQIVPGANNDSVSLYAFSSMNAVPESMEEAIPVVAPLADGAKPDIDPARVMLRGFDADGLLLVDGIRIATTWTEAIAKSELPEPPVEDALDEVITPASKTVKLLDNGHVLIKRGAQLYNILGRTTR